MRPQRCRHVSALLGALSAGACAAPAGPPLPEAPAAHPPKPAPHVAAPANLVPGLFSYSAVGRRDPFRSYLAELAEQTAAQAPNRAREETEQFELDQYRLTGLITGTSQPKAMVEDPSGRGHVLHIGSRLGRNGGRLTHIGASAVVVVEETRDPAGKKLRLPITIKLPHTEFDDAAAH